jgi:large subunit ribosomal protein L7/L12
MAMGMMPAMAMGGAPAAAAAEEAEEQTRFTVVLKDVGRGSEVIKIVRSLTNLGLKEAKDLVEGAPSNVMEAVSRKPLRTRSPSSRQRAR